MPSDKPFPLEHVETLVPTLDTGTALHIGGIWGNVASGDTWLATDGRRLVWSADAAVVIYTIGTQFYVQSSRGFRHEVKTYPFIEAARRAAPMVKLAEAEMKLLMGVVAGASGVGFAIVIGSEVLQFAVENRNNFAIWKRQLETVLKARDFLKTYAPTLYDKLFWAILKQVYGDAKSKVPDSVTADTVAFGVGVVVGAVGKSVAKGKFSWLALIFVIIEQIVIRFSLNVAPKALELTAGEYRSLAEEIINRVRDSGVTITEADIGKIVHEVQEHSDAIKQAYRMLKEVFDREKRSNESR